MSELELREAFQELAGGVKPKPDPYARLMSRARRRRFSRWFTGVAAAMAALVIAPVTLNAADEPTPKLGPIDNSVLLITPWTRQLIDAPVRGALAADTKLVDEAGKAARSLKTGLMSGYPVKVLFIEDVGDKRIVVAVRHSKTHQVGIAAAAPRGARGDQLAEAFRHDVYMESLTPFTAIEFGSGIAQNLRHAGMAIAPPGCEIARATQDSQAPQWKVSGKGDYLVWSQSVADQLVRVICAGMRRYEGALLDLANMVQATSDLAAFQAATLAGSGYDVPALIFQDMMSNTYPPQAVGPLRVIFSGSVTGMTNPAYVSADPVDKGRWRVQIHAGSGFSRLLTTSDVLAADAVVAMDIPDDGVADGVLVVAPPSAVNLEIRDRASGALLTSVPLAKGAALVPMRAAEDMVLRAFDASGSQIGTGVFPLSKPSVPSELFMPETMENWEQR